MKIEVARPEAEPVAGRDRRNVAQRSVLEAIDLERAGILGAAGRGVVAARDEESGPVARRREHLVAVDAGIDLARLAHLITERAVTLDAMDGDIAGVVVGGEEIFA